MFPTLLACSIAYRGCALPNCTGFRLRGRGIGRIISEVELTHREGLHDAASDITVLRCVIKILEIWVDIYCDRVKV